MDGRIYIECGFEAGRGSIVRRGAGGCGVVGGP